ncbi:hypothetical protein I352_02119 [Cryptococcus deuterogattii MMRL2647]|nr:hypothetical protein I352_02119 [Cryptococcus deuterogattii MMRL2647]
MLTSFPTLQVKDVYGTDLCASHLIFKMDEAGFDLGYEQKARKMSLNIHGLYMRQGHPPDVFDAHTRSQARNGRDRPLLFVGGEESQRDY